MRIASLKIEGLEKVCVLIDRVFVPVEAVDRKFSGDIVSLLETGRFNELKKRFDAKDAGTFPALKEKGIPEDRAEFAPLYRRPHKIWGIGLNYREHAADLSEKAPTGEPASFMKPDTAIIGYGETIRIPEMSKETTSEAELGIIFGKQCKNVDKSQWLGAVAGFTTIIDTTAVDILQRNPRNLTQSKSFDTFFSFGPVMVTPDEIDDVFKLEVATMHNGGVHAKNVVSNMTFPPDFLVSYHSRIMTMLPGDIISSGTPGAAVIHDGDTVECRIAGFTTLVNHVKI